VRRAITALADLTARASLPVRANTLFATLDHWRLATAERAFFVCRVESFAVQGIDGLQWAKKYPPERVS